MNDNARFYTIYATTMEALVNELNDTLPDTQKVIYIGLSYDKEKAFCAVVDSCFSVVVTPDMMIDYILQDNEEPNNDEVLPVTRAGKITQSA